MNKDLRDGFSEVSSRLDEVDQTLVHGFVTLHSDLLSIDGALSELSAKFDWGIIRLETAISSVRDSLEDLIRLAKTPEQTWAYEQFSIARDAFQRGLYPEALDHAEWAISGYQSHPGYKLEHRFHHLVGMIRRGDHKNCSSEIVNLARAEQAYLHAARYAGESHKADAGLALCAAGWVAYCQNKINEAGVYTQQALNYVNLPEANYQMAKIYMHQGNLDSGLEYLRRAIEFDHLFAVRCFDDGDFLIHEAAIQGAIRGWSNILLQKCNRIYTELDDVAIDLDNISKNLKTIYRSFDLDDVRRTTEIPDIISKSRENLRRIIYLEGEAPLTLALHTYSRRGEALALLKQYAQQISDELSLRTRSWEDKLKEALNRLDKRAEITGWLAGVAGPVALLPKFVELNHKFYWMLYAFVSVSWLAAVKILVEIFIRQRRLKKVTSNAELAVARLGEIRAVADRRILSVEKFVSEFRGPFETQHS
jgi:tetratricopeptide (TPR) repeat protein